jgi:hypothetical protein
MSGFKVRSKINNAVHEKLNHIMGKIQDHNSIYAFEDKEYTFPGGNISCITITMVAAGAAGGHGTIKNGIFYSGGGGAAGGSIIKKPVLIINPMKEDITIKIKVGIGGNIENPDGGDTSVCIYVGSKIIFKITAQGGKRGGSTDSNNKGGQGGTCGSNEMLGGYNGQNGSITLSSIGKIFGGNGGNSAFEEGGLGGYQKNHFKIEDDLDGFEHPDNSHNPQGQNGIMGSGGGGSVPGLDPKLIGFGGNGFAILEF